MTQEDTDNIKKIKDLVKKGFYLKDDSYELFEKLLDNQVHAEEFSQIAQAPEKRLFIDISDSIAQTIDKSFDKFKNHFAKFCNDTNITYKEFTAGKVKNVKLLKALTDYYISVDNVKFKMFCSFIAHRNGSYEEIVFKILQNIFKTKNFTENYTIIMEYYQDNNWYLFEGDKIFVKARNIQTGKKVTLRKKVSDKDLMTAVKKTDLFEKFNTAVNKEYLGNRIASDKYKLCLSLNYADWLLCSTKNNWSSCLSLENNNGYWTGLAGLVGDRNRIMIFITDMERKEFKGIKSYNMLFRAWAFTIIKENKIKIYSNRLYPTKIGFDLNSLSKTFNDTPFTEKMEGGRSKYSIPILWHRRLRNYENTVPVYDVFTSEIYEDTARHEYTFDQNYSYYVYPGVGLKSVGIYEPTGEMYDDRRSFYYNKTYDQVIEILKELKAA